MADNVYPEIHGDYSGVDRELSRVRSLPGRRGEVRLERELAVVFATTEALVHKVTGALAASGRTAANLDEERHRWEGQMTFGGPAPGFFPRPRRGNRREVEHNPALDARSREEVVYAWYEMRRGGSHDYFRMHHQYDLQFADAVMGVLKGGEL